MSSLRYALEGTWMVIKVVLLVAVLMALLGAPLALAVYVNPGWGFVYCLYILCFMPVATGRR